MKILKVCENMLQAICHLTGRILSMVIIRGKKLTSCSNNLLDIKMFWSNVYPNLRIRFSDAGAPMDVMEKCWSNSTENLSVKMMQFLSKWIMFYFITFFIHLLIQCYYAECYKYIQLIQLNIWIWTQENNQIIVNTLMPTYI